jgi:hypothetical protein
MSQLGTDIAEGHGFETHLSRLGIGLGFMEFRFVYTDGPILHLYRQQSL